MRTERIGLIVVLLLLAVGNLIRTGALATMRAVDVLQIFAAGILLGVLMVQLTARFRKGSE